MSDTASGIIAKLRFVDITTCDAATLEAVRTLRNHPRVRRFMYTTHEISPEEHVKWAASLKGAAGRRFFVVFSDDEIAGTVNWSSRGEKLGRIHWGFYVNPEMAGRGVGSAMLTQFLEMIFADGQTEKIVGEARLDNAASQALHKRLGFVEQERVDVEGDGGEAVSALRFVLSRRDWLENRAAAQQGK